MPQLDGWSQLPPAQPHSQSCGSACPGGAPGTPSTRSSLLHSESRTPIPPPPSPLLPPSSRTWLQRPALGSSYQQQPRQDLQERPHLPGPCGAVAPTLRDRQSRDERSRAGSALTRAARARQGPAGREQEAGPWGAMEQRCTVPRARREWVCMERRQSTASPGQGETPSSPQIPRWLRVAHGWGDSGWMQ